MTMFGFASGAVSATDCGPNTIARKANAIEFTVGELFILTGDPVSRVAAKLAPTKIGIVSMSLYDTENL
jgi:hypothetical protein